MAGAVCHILHMPAAQPKPDDLVYDWNELARKGRIIPPDVEFFDETLRDGLQNPSVTDPKIEDKLRILHLMDAIGAAWRVHDEAPCYPVIAKLTAPGAWERELE